MEMAVGQTTYAVGVILSSSENPPSVKDAVKAWADGRCVSMANINKTWMEDGLRDPRKTASQTAPLYLEDQIYQLMFGASHD